MRALDLFAGWGWGVACQRLGIDEMGVEIMPEAVATREANGMSTIYRDVWEGLTHDPLDYDMLIASPPCQTFSMAGSGAGRRALNDVIDAIKMQHYKHPAKLKAFGERHDPKTALVLTPLAHVWRDTPRLVVFEQVPQVPPVWETCAEEMRRWGYSVTTEILNAEQYGVPQTRRRAILVARWDGEARMPTPTHSRYYSRSPEKLDLGVEKWVSMREALGWGMTDRPSMTVTGGGSATGGAEPFGTGARRGIERERDAGRWFVSNDRQEHSARRAIDEPAPTITAGHDTGNRVWVNGTGEHAARRDASEPAPTIHFGQRLNSVSWETVETGQNSAQGHGKTKRYTKTTAAPAPTVTGQTRSWRFAGAGRTSEFTGRQVPRLMDEPAHTLMGGRNAAWLIDGDASVGSIDASRALGSTSTKVTLEEAAALQTAPSDFVFVGAKTKQFLLVGNAVPPVLGQAILETLL